VILDGLVSVNGEVCTMRGKKIHSGDMVEFEGQKIRVIHED
jgi:ribosome-associated protein